MKRSVAVLLVANLILMVTPELFSQAESLPREFGISAGGLTNFPTNQDYLTLDINMFSVAPYVRTGQHEFSAGILFPLSAHAIYVPDQKINPRVGATAGYKFYLFDVEGRENLFIHYSFQYLRFKGDVETIYLWYTNPENWTETDMYINNVIGLGYSLFFDTKERFGMYYTLDYVISQRGYKMAGQGLAFSFWATDYIWNNLSTQVGFSFKILPIGKKVKK